MLQFNSSLIYETNDKMNNIMHIAYENDNY